MERVIVLSALRKLARVDDNFRLKWPEISSIIERMVPLEPAHRFTACQLLVEFRRCADNYRREGIISTNEYAYINVNASPCIITEANLSDACSELPNVRISSNKCSSEFSNLKEKENKRNMNNELLVDINTNNNTFQKYENDNSEIIQLRQRNAELETEIQELKAIILKLTSSEKLK